jgi:hypothetical protein
MNCRTPLTPILQVPLALPHSNMYTNIYDTLINDARHKRLYVESFLLLACLRDFVLQVTQISFPFSQAKDAHAHNNTLKITHTKAHAQKHTHKHTHLFPFNPLFFHTKTIDCPSNQYQLLQIE